ncbi:MAG: tRNA lysidine(34) synthetase TilS [Albidovulum sp.]
MSGKDRPSSDGDDAFLLHVAEHAFRSETPDVIAVAVSGGSDSMALLSLFARIQARRGGQLRAVTVDHRLRPEAADEAQAVAAFCQKINVPHDILVWDHGEITGNLQDQARRARYGLIGEWAQRSGIGHIVLGHTADDQAETFLMGLAREAGIDGLSGMRPGWVESGIRWARPYLLTPRSDLRQYLTRHGISWIEDPSNADDRFTRIKARRVLERLRPLGISVEKLTGVVVNLGSARSALQTATSDAAHRIAQAEAGAVILDRVAFQALPAEISRRLLIGALKWVSGQDYAPRQAALMRVQEAVRGGRHTTLSGCRIHVSTAEVQITREPKAVAGLEGPTDALWDGRWRVNGPHGAGLIIRALGNEGLRLCPDWRESGNSRAALIVSPAIWRDDTLISAPLTGFGAGWSVEIVADLHSFLLSH